jgi:hypothetical protein
MCFPFALGDNCPVNLTLKRGHGIFIFNGSVLAVDSNDPVTPGGEIDFTTHPTAQRRMLAENSDAPFWSSSATTAPTWIQQAIIYSAVTV